MQLLKTIFFFFSCESLSMVLLGFLGQPDAWVFFTAGLCFSAFADLVDLGQSSK